MHNNSIHLGKLQNVYNIPPDISERCRICSEPAIMLFEMNIDEDDMFLCEECASTAVILLNVKRHLELMEN
jgi:hypothetical protein